MLPKRLASLRKKKKLSQQNIADFLGITRQGYGKYEKGESEPSNDSLQKLADFYGVSIDFLTGRTDRTDFFNPLSEINKILEEQGIENLFFYDMDAWKNFTPEDVEELRKHFEWVAHKAKERNKGEKK